MSVSRCLTAVAAVAAVGACRPGDNPLPGPALGARQLLVILWDPHRPDHPAPDKQAIADLIFGADPSVAGYFIDSSRGRVALEKAAVLGWYDALKPAEHYWAPSDDQDSDGDGWISGHVEKWAEAVRDAAREFDFAAYDKNGDGILEPDELGVMIVIPQNGAFGTNRQAFGRQYPTPEPLVVDGVRIDAIAEAYIGKPPAAPLVAHELGHLFFDAADEYFWFFFPYAAGSYSLFDQSWALMHADPYSRLLWGWLDPIRPETSGWYSLRSMDQTGDLMLLRDPKRGDGEFFLIENRERGRYYDSRLVGEGLAIWLIIQDPDVFSALPAPAGVSAAEWGKIPGNDWGRRAIRMIRPETTVFDDRKALWGPADEIKLFWHDGAPSGFTLKNVSDPGAEMGFYLDIAK